MKNNLFYIFLISTIVVSCVEEISFIEEEETFESVIVIDAAITNELKQQEVLLSRTYAFEENGPNPESGATITLEGNQEVFNFTETETGLYKSDVTFSAQQNVNYKLVVKTNNNRIYKSSPMQLTQSTEIDDLYAARDNDDYGVNGMSIYVDSFDPLNNSKYYRYTYEETYKIIAPKWVPEEVVVTDVPTCEVELRDRNEEVQTCYNTVPSSSLNLKTTNGLSEDRVSRHLVRFINSDDFILSWRYSIKVSQYVHSFDAYNYYEILKNLSEEGSLFSQSQAGFISSNIVSETNPKEKVIGFFDVTSVTDKRLFFNYVDFYENENIPPFPVTCEPAGHDQFGQSAGVCGGLITELLTDRVVYHNGASRVRDTTFLADGTMIVDTITVGPFNMVLKQCGDCTAIGSNEVPDFWED